MNSLAAVTLGYSDPDVVAAVQKQLKKGVIFSLPSTLEMQVAEKLVQMIPCAEWARFGKNGSDATAGAIRLARAYTKRDHVAACGYHGWQDWYIGATARNRGVPRATQALTHLFQYNRLDTLEKIFHDYPDGIAAVIMEPMNVAEPAPGYLESVKDLAHRHGALLIFDETITGFRFANGGAQELFGITPDVATFGKGMANGYPVSAVVGAARFMPLMEEIFFSFTFGGELLSLAAAQATLTKLTRRPILKTMHRQGKKLLEGLRDRIQRHGVGHFLSVSGHPSWIFLTFQEASPYTLWQIKTLFLQEFFARGILFIGTHNMSFAHSDRDITRTLQAYDEVLPLLRSAVAEKTLESALRCRPLEPLFKVR